MQCVRPILVRGNFVPCGKCPNCLANQRQEWIFRLRSEYMAAKFGLFVTLTYNDENYPATGTSKEDVQKFLKRLRKALGMRSFRYFIVSEYGDHTLRGHYHGLFFFQEACSLGIGEELYNVFVKAWNKGFLKFGNIEEGSIVYCTKYCLKQSPTPSYYLKPFRLMSRMPGIGDWYIQKFGAFHADQKKLAIANLFGVKSRMPRYFRVRIQNHLEDYEVLELVEDSQNKGLRDGFKKYNAFCRLKHLEQNDDSWNLWLNYEEEKRQRKSEVVIAHTKKQTF